MPRKFRTYDPEQQLLLPPDLADWVPEKHPARFISEMVDLLDMSPFYKVYEGALGQPPYHPAMMLKVILYCFSRGIYSSRKMEDATYDDVGTRFLATDQHPDYSSFCNFRLRHGDSVHSTFVQVVQMCRQLGLCSLGHVSIDGTIVKGNASRSNNVKTEEIDKQIEEDEKLIREMIAKWESKDAEAEPESGMPEELKKKKNRLQALRRAKAVAERITKERHERELQRYEEEERTRQEEYEKAKAEKRDAFNNRGPDLQETRKAAGLTQAKLAEKAGVNKHRISNLERGHRYPSDDERRKLANALGQDSVSFRKIPEPDELGERKPPQKKPPLCTNLTDPESACIPRPGKGTTQGYNAQYAVDSDKQVIVGLYMSNETHDRNNLKPTIDGIIEVTGEKPKELSADSGYFRTDLFDDPLIKEMDVYMPPDRKKKNKIENPHPHAEAMREKLSTEEGKKRKHLRSKTVEPVFGHIKHCRRFDRFLTRGVKKVTTEWTLLAITHNLMKIFGTRR